MFSDALTPQTLSVIITYYPNDVSLENIIRSADQFEKTLVIDNSCSGLVKERLLDVQGRAVNVSLHFNQINMGIAAALNAGFQYAKKNGFDWVMTLDQDTVLPSGAVASMLAAWQDLDEHLKLRARLIVPCYLYAGRASSHCLKQKKVTSSIAITSANLVHLSLWEDLGGYDETLIIDYVDTDFCLRMLRNGFQMLVVPEVQVLHELGRVEKVRIIGLEFSYTRYSAGRRYYQFRNRIKLYKRHWKRARWLMGDFWQLLKDLGKVFIFEGWINIRAAVIGLRDGVAGRDSGETSIDPGSHDIG